MMKKISMQKDDRIDFLWDKYILECRLQGYSEVTLRNKEYNFAVFLRFLGNRRRARDLTKDVCVSIRLVSCIQHISEESLRYFYKLLNGRANG